MSLSRKGKLLILKLCLIIETSNYNKNIIKSGRFALVDIISSISIDGAHSLVYVKALMSGKEPVRSLVKDMFKKRSQIRYITLHKQIRIHTNNFLIQRVLIKFQGCSSGSISVNPFNVISMCLFVKIMVCS